MIAQQLVNGIMLGSIYVLVAVAFTLTLGMLKFLNFSIPALFMLGGMVSWGLLRNGLHWLPAFAITIAFVVFCSLVIERFTYRWLRLSAHHVPLVSSLGFLILLENLAIIRYGSDAVGYPNLILAGNSRLGPLIVSLPQLLALAIALMAVVMISVILARSRFGRSIRGMAENSTTAQMVGIDVNRTAATLYAITGLLAGVGGILFALSYSTTSWYMGHEVALKALSAMVLGGMGNVWGAVIGGLIVGLAEVLAIAYISSDAVNVVVYGGLLALLICRPQGLLPGRDTMVERM